MAKRNEIAVTSAKVTRKWIEKSDDLDVICRAWENYAGSTEVLEGAIGALLFGRLAGYNALRIIHSWRTLKKYEKILDVTFAEVLPADTADSDRVNGVRYAKKFKAFWKAVAAGVGSDEGAKDVLGKGTASLATE